MTGICCTRCFKSKCECVTTEPTRVQHYLTLVDGLFGLRALGPLSQDTEGEIAGTHAELWDTMTEEEQAEVEHGIVMLKEKWKQ